MGCCVSKCGPKKHSLEECYHVQDKLVISQPPKTPKVSMSNKISPSPPSPTTSASSPSFTFTNSSATTSSSCTSLSTGSSISCSKDRSFSNEFLWSCVKENPHVIRINSLKERSQLLVSPDVHVHKLDYSSAKNSITEPSKQSTPQRVSGSTLQKRVRSNSPTIQTRQKSFRREPADQRLLNSSYSLSNRSLMRSPTPSRRFNIDSGRWALANTPKEICSKRFVGSKVSAATSISSSLKRESLRLASPYLNSSQLRSCLRNNRSETRIHRITSKIDEVAVEKALAHPDGDPVAMEDMDNPLISLDCFIFL